MLLNTFHQQYWDAYDDLSEGSSASLDPWCRSSDLAASFFEGVRLLQELFVTLDRDWAAASTSALHEHDFLASPLAIGTLEDLVSVAAGQEHRGRGSLKRRELVCRRVCMPPSVRPRSFTENIPVNNP